MTPDQQRIAIAQACGVLVRLDDALYRRMYQEWDDAQDPLFCLTPPSRWKLVGCDRLPDYTSDLNAMHVAEKVLSMGQLVQYGNLLNRMDLKYNYGYVESVINATAAQRAEAFLRTIGKWSDE